MKFGEKVYWCALKKDLPLGQVEYEEPVEFTLRVKYMSVQPASGYSALQQFGTEVSKYQNMICQPYDTWYGKFSEGDLFYLDGKAPTGDEEYAGEGANYAVDVVNNQNVGIRVILKKVN